MNSIAGIILAAGKGTRLKSQDVNKVTFSIGNKPLIVRSVELLKNSGIDSIFVVVGFAKESVMKALEGMHVNFIDQNDQEGTAHAVGCALPSLPSQITDSIVIQGDDSYFYSPSLIQELLTLHRQENASCTFLTITVADPNGLGRIIRDSTGQIMKVQEEKDANEIEKEITEINPGCYIFSTKFLQSYLSRIEKNPITQEYYLTSLIAIGYNNKEKVIALTKTNMKWRGINTQEELEQANSMYN